MAADTRDQAGEGAVLTRHLNIGLRDVLITRSVKEIKCNLKHLDMCVRY